MVDRVYVRYAQAERFAPPELLGADCELAPEEIRMCPQGRSRLEHVMGLGGRPLVQGEDCLIATVVSPRFDRAGRPVMVFFHGGAFSTGAGTLDCYDGQTLADEADVVVVSVSYRLGAFGYLHLADVSDGNLGLLDQLVALRWVAGHISEYGGDAGDVTVFGQSAGGGSIALLLECEGADSLFRRAIIQSSRVDVSRSVTVADEVGRQFRARLGRDPRTASAAELVQAQAALASSRPGRPGPAMFGPVRGVGPLAESPASGESLGGLSLLVGWNRDEASAYGVAREDATTRTDSTYADPWIDRGRELTAAGLRVRGYRLDWRPPGSPFGATHTVELPLLLGGEASWADSPMLGDLTWPEVSSLGQQMRHIWAHFARTGDIAPHDPDLPVRFSDSRLERLRLTPAAAG